MGGSGWSHLLRSFEVTALLGFLPSCLTSSLPQHPWGYILNTSSLDMNSHLGHRKHSRWWAQHSENEDHGIWSHHFMGNRWGNCGNNVRLYFLGAPESLQMVTAAMKLKRCLLLGRKAMTNLDSILKSRDITLPTKVRLVKALVFPVVMCGCESWTVKKAEHQRIDAFELWCWRRLLRVPWTARRSALGVLWKEWC